MRILACLVCITLMLLSPSRLNCQERGGSVRMRVKDERGTPRANETTVYTESHALLIGNSMYDDSAWSDLPDVAQDLAAVKDVLERQHGFKVEVAPNRNRDALLREIDQFVSRYGQRLNNRLLIYYSGHGYTALLPDERRMGYLVMPDAPPMPPEERALRTPPAEEEFERFLPSAITMDEIETYARRITARHAFFVFDSCFSGTALYKNLGVGVPSQITTEELKSVRAYLTAGNETQRVPAYSRFRRKFVAALSGAADSNGDGYILASELGRWVSIEVEKETGRRQTPIFGKDERFSRGDMIFVSPRGAAAAQVAAAATPPAPPATPQRSSEQLYWQEIEKRGTVSGYRTYLSTYPKGEYAGVAQLRIENLSWEGFKGLAQSLSKYEFVESFSNDRAIVVLKGKYGFIDRTGREVIPPKYGRAGKFSEWLAWVWLEGKWGVIDITGNYVIAPKYPESWPRYPPHFSEGLALVFVNGKGGFVDRSGKEVTEFKYTGGGSFSEGLATVYLNGKLGYIDKSGREVIPPLYEYGWPFSQGVARVKLNGEDSYIDKTGRKVFPQNYAVTSEETILVMSRSTHKYGVADKTGKEIVPLKYDDIGQFSVGVAEVRLNGKLGFIDTTGKEIVPAKYDEIWCRGFLGDGFVGVRLGGRRGFVDFYGNEYFDFNNLKTGEGATRPPSSPSTTDPALTDMAGGSPPKTTPAIVSVQQFVIQPDACRVSGRDVVCRLTVENKSDERREFGISHNNWEAKKYGARRLGATQASDRLGNIYYLAESSIGSHRYTDSFRNMTALAPRASAKLLLRFAHVPANITSFPSLRVTAAVQRNNDVLLTDAIFKNVPITK